MVTPQVYKANSNSSKIKIFDIKYLQKIPQRKKWPVISYKFPADSKTGFTAYKSEGHKTICLMING